MNWRDLAFKTLWTALSVILGGVVVWLADVDTSWAGLAILVANAALAFIRQKLGAVPPELEAAKAAGVAPQPGSST